jgi:hypothetical protein
MARGKSVQDPALLEAALQGLELQRQRIDEQIEYVRSMLGQGVVRRGRPPRKGTGEPPATPKRELSPAARKRIAAAQKKRWAQFRKENSPPAA